MHALKVYENFISHSIEWGNECNIYQSPNRKYIVKHNTKDFFTRVVFYIVILVIPAFSPCCDKKKSFWFDGNIRVKRNIRVDYKSKRKLLCTILWLFYVSRPLAISLKKVENGGVETVEMSRSRKEHYMIIFSL